MIAYLQYPGLVGARAFVFLITTRRALLSYNFQKIFSIQLTTLSNFSVHLPPLTTRFFQKNMARNKKFVRGAIQVDTFGVPKFPNQIEKIPEESRADAVGQVKEGITTRLRLLHFLLGAFGVLVTALLIGLTIGLDGAAGNYLSCFYTTFGTPSTTSLLKVISNGCASPFLVATVTLGLYALLYHFVILIFQFDEYTRYFFDGIYDNPYRWVARAWAEPIFLLLALEASGMRSLVTLAALMVIQSFAEYMRFASESNTRYVYEKNAMRTKISERGRSSLHGAAYLSAIVVLTVLVSWIAFVAQDTSGVPLITWLYAPAFLLLYTIFAFWSHIAMLPGATYYGARARTEFYWDIYIFIAYVILATLATICSIYTLQ